MRAIFNLLLKPFIFYGTVFLACIPAHSLAQDTTETQEKSNWSGIWNAENTLLTIKVWSDGQRFVVDPVETMGLVWNTSNGRINGSSAFIEVEYQGVSARVIVDQIDRDTAVARALSCQPDYHVICALVRNQQARFVRTNSVSE
ncbi:MAG: hypothetical protein RQ757_13645 [Pseudomonadales bacterium]|nr:hypothetical protein [Pseudomonadales bacterium]